MNNFYVLGSARCRTYWFSRLFNCYHEWYAFNDKPLPDGAGTAENHIPVMTGKSVVILREPQESIESILNAFPVFRANKPKVESMITETYEKLLLLDSPKYDFHNLDKFIPEIWEYLLEVPVDMERINEYKSRRLTVEGALQCLG